MMNVSRIMLDFKGKRKVVIHETCFLKGIKDVLHDNDVLFFDDCLYSQYEFIKANIDELKKRKIVCILGLSSRIVRESCVPIREASCVECHDAFHSGIQDALNAYMSIAEVKELLEEDNIALACHGARHLRLECTTSKIQASIAFINDVTTAVKDFKRHSLETSIFVFPYAYDDITLAYCTLNKLGFKHIFAGKQTKRIPIESLVAREYNILE